MSSLRLAATGAAAALTLANSALAQSAGNPPRKIKVERVTTTGVEPAQITTSSGEVLVDLDANGKVAINWNAVSVAAESPDLMARMVARALIAARDGR